MDMQIVSIGKGSGVIGEFETRMENGSWNEKTAYTIMPIEGLVAYNKCCNNEENGDYE